MTFAFAEFIDLVVASGEQAAKAAVSFAIRWISQNLKAVDGDKPRADKKFDVAIFSLGISAHYTGKAVAVGDADGGKAEFICSLDHLLRVRGAAQEGKIGGHGKFGIGDH